MIGQEITFDGHRLNDLFYVGEVAIGLPDFSPTLESKVGDGSFVRGSRMEGPTISVLLVAKPFDGSDAQDAVSTLLSWLDVDEPRPLYLSSDRGKWRLCIPQGAPSSDDSEWYDKVTVTFVQPDPALYGREMSITVPSGGSASFRVGGDYPTCPTVTAADAVADGASGQWGVRLDDGDAMRVSIPSDEETTVAIDCGGRSCTVGGTVTAPTLTSDWFELRGGPHVIENDVGSGDCTVTWTERWHR